MSHPEQMEFVRCGLLEAEQFLKPRRVLEIGSGDINGSVRSLFSKVVDLAYTGVDVAPGPGVDVVESGHRVNLPDGYFDAVLSLECFEHNPYWAETLENMVRMCRPGGLILLSCAALGRPEHGTQRTTPGDSLATGIGWSHYRNLSQRELVRRLVASGGIESLFACTNIWGCDLFVAAIKAGDGTDAPYRYRDQLERWRSKLTARNNDVATAALSLVFATAERLGVQEVPWYRYRLVQLLKRLKRVAGAAA